MTSFHQWWRRHAGDEPPLEGDVSAFFVSLLFHLCLLVSLGLIPVILDDNQITLVVSAVPDEQRPELKIPDEFIFREQPSDAIGSNSDYGGAAALALAPLISDVSVIPHQVDVIRTDVERPQIEINDIVQVASGTYYSHNLRVKGSAGEGVTGAEGAIDRITHEILLSLEERKTLVAWLFDQTDSIKPQRQTIRDRFQRIHEELGIIQAKGSEAFAKHDDKPLLSAVLGFGQGLHLMTNEPTDDLEELKRAVMDIPGDDSGTENVFTAVFETAKKYARYRYTSSQRSQPERNVMIVVFTDEAGSDQERAEETIKMCRRWAIPVYVVGVPAPFGRKETEFKWVDPDPAYRQVDQWGVVEQGPETFYPERIKLSFSGSREDEQPIDSGFGPYALTRLCYETSGIYFSVHPNRTTARTLGRREIEPYAAYLQRFFDPEVMRKYRPQYVSIPEYQKQVSQNKAREALVQAANASQVSQMENPTLVFIKRDEADFSRLLTEAQQKAAALEPRINSLYEILRQGEADREKETVLRWQAGYDLAMGRVLAVKVRTETYNAMLAAAKRGLKFEDSKNNTWELRPADEISVGSQYAKLAERARMYLERVVREHPDTPWAMLAQRELNDKLGWKWTERFTDLAPPPRMLAKNNPNVPKGMPAPQQPVVIEKKLRPVPKKL